MHELPERIGAKLSEFQLPILGRTPDFSLRQRDWFMQGLRKVPHSTARVRLSSKLVER